MKSLPFILLIALAIPNITPVYAQNPPAETYQPGFWQPVARFDTKRPIVVNITNNTDISIEYDLTGIESENVNPVSLTSGNSGKIEDFGNSANIVIYPLDKTTNEFNLRFEAVVNEEDNSVNVSVFKDKPEFFGHRSIDLQENGAIYFY